MRLSIRNYRSSDSKRLAELFYQTIHSIGPEQYSQAQVNAWAPSPIDYQRWQRRLAEHPPFVAELDKQIVGFISLTQRGHIEWIFTHKDFQGRGIAGHLYAHLEQSAIAQGFTVLTVNASRFARPFFAKHGFSTARKINIPVRGEILVNWLMEKALSGNPTPHNGFTQTRHHT